MSSNPLVSGTRCEGNVAEQAIREELSRLLESPIFAQSNRLARFLRFTIETTLAGNADVLKEYVIGTEVYDRRPPYHPSADSIVRTEARRLRNKLTQYYESCGKNDPVFVSYRPGSYVPAFHHHHPRASDHMAMHEDVRELLIETLLMQALNLSSLPDTPDLEIVFEGTLRIMLSGQESSGLRNSRHAVRFATRSTSVLPKCKVTAIL